MDGEMLSRLGFAGDIVLMAEARESLRGMMEDLHGVCGTVGLKIDVERAIMVCRDNMSHIVVPCCRVECVPQYVCLGQTMALCKDGRERENRGTGGI